MPAEDSKLPWCALINFPNVLTLHLCLQGGIIEIGAPTGKWQLIVVYRGKHCPVSRNYLASLQQIIYELDDLGVEVLALTADGREKAEAFVSFSTFLCSNLPVLVFQHCMGQCCHFISRCSNLPSAVAQALQFGLSGRRHFNAASYMLLSQQHRISSLFVLCCGVYLVSTVCFCSSVLIDCSAIGITALTSHMQQRLYTSCTFVAAWP